MVVPAIAGVQQSPIGAIALSWEESQQTALNLTIDLRDQLRGPGEAEQRCQTKHGNDGIFVDIFVFQGLPQPISARQSAKSAKAIPMSSGCSK